MNSNDNSTMTPFTDATSRDAAEHAKLLQRIISDLAPLTTDERRRLIETVTTFYGLAALRPETQSYSIPAIALDRPQGTTYQFSEETDSPKAFLLNKAPKTDVERVACLAYYLTHFRATPHFKTRDISSLNTESAHRKFANPAHAVDNATKLGYLVPSVKGAKQLSATGEQFVQALPDRDAARAVLSHVRIRRPSRGVKKSRKKTL